MLIDLFIFELRNSASIKVYYCFIDFCIYMPLAYFCLFSASLGFAVIEVKVIAIISLKD